MRRTRYINPVSSFHFFDAHALLTQYALRLVEPHTTYYSPIKKAPLFFPFSLDRLPLVQGAVDIQRERDDGKVVMQAGRIGKATMQAGENNGEERRYDDLGGGDEVHGTSKSTN